MLAKNQYFNKIDFELTSILQHTEQKDNKKGEPSQTSQDDLLTLARLQLGQNLSLQSIRQQSLTNFTSCSARRLALVGIENELNSCYINAALQCLFRLPLFTSLLEDARPKDPKQGNELLKTLKFFHKIKRQSNNEDAIVSLLTFKKNIHQLGKRFVSNQPNDSIFFIRNLLNYFTESTSESFRDLFEIQLQKSIEIKPGQTVKIVDKLLDLTLKNQNQVQNQSSQSQKKQQTNISQSTNKMSITEAINNQLNQQSGQQKILESSFGPILIINTKSLSGTSISEYRVIRSQHYQEDKFQQEDGQILYELVAAIENQFIQKDQNHHIALIFGQDNQQRIIEYDDEQIKYRTEEEVDFRQLSYLFYQIKSEQFEIDHEWDQYEEPPWVTQQHSNQNQSYAAKADFQGKDSNKEKHQKKKPEFSNIKKRDYQSPKTETGNKRLVNLEGLTKISSWGTGGESSAREQFLKDNEVKLMNAKKEKDEYDVDYDKGKLKKVKKKKERDIKKKANASVSFNKKFKELKKKGQLNQQH